MYAPGETDQGRGAPQSQMSAAEWINPSNLMYSSELENDYGSMIHFESRNAEKIVRNFDIKCDSRMDNRYLPLFNLILARLPGQNEHETKTNTFALERDGEVKIIDSHELPNGEAYETVAFQINKWNELVPMGSITSSAVLNACFSSYGPIWLID